MSVLHNLTFLLKVEYIAWHSLQYKMSGTQTDKVWLRYQSLFIYFQEDLFSSAFHDSIHKACHNRPLTYSGLLLQSFWATNTQNRE